MVSADDSNTKRRSDHGFEQVAQRVSFEGDEWRTIRSVPSLLEDIHPDFGARPDFLNDGGQPDSMNARV